MERILKMKEGMKERKKGKVSKDEGKKGANRRIQKEGGSE